MKKTSKYLGMFFIAFINLTPIYGVLFLEWKIADVFFWYWFEFIIDLFFTYNALKLHWGNKINSDSRLQKAEKGEFWWFSALFILYATIFLMGAIVGDLIGKVETWSDYIILWNFIWEKKIIMFMIFSTKLIDFWREESMDKASFESITGPLTTKAMVIGIFYFILMIQYHGSGSNGIPQESWYILFELIAFMLSRFIVDIINLHKEETEPIIIKN